MPALSAAEFARASGGRLVGDDAGARTIVADSRAVTSGAAFAAVGGGHDFVAEALSKGASYAIVDRADAVPAGASGVVVDDVVRALMATAAVVRDRMDVPVVALTGSTGKTLTKDLIAAALSATFRVHATPKSYNAELGVPLTVFGAPDDTQILVLELAARHVGEIAELCAIARPTSGAITGIGYSHIGEFGTREMIARTKSELLASLPSGGTAFVPSDDDYLDVLVASTSARVVTIGPGGAVRYRAERVDGDGRTHGTVRIDGRTIPVILPVAGRALLRNAAFALAIAAANGVDPNAAAGAMADARMSSWRMELHRIGGRVVVNDAYNANPTSVSSALRAVREMAGTRPVWAVLGLMAELGDVTAAEHRRMGALAAGLGYDTVIVVGDQAAGIADGAMDVAQRVGSPAEALDALEQAPSDAVIVVKASRAVGLEHLVDELLGRWQPASKGT